MKLLQNIKLSFQFGKQGLYLNRAFLTSLLKSPSFLKASQDHSPFQHFMGEMATLFLQQNGPLFIKLGQILSARDDLIPEFLCEHFEKLLDQQKQLPFKQIKTVLKKSYRGKKWPFKSIEKKPLGVGSIGSVYAAVLKDKSKVIVKVARPQIQKKIQEDYQLLTFMIDLLYKTHMIKNEAIYDTFKRLLHDLKQNIDLECDFRNELKNLDFFSHNIIHKDIYIPKTYPDYSNSKVIVMERVDGISLKDWLQQGNSEEKRQLFAKKIGKEILSQIFINGQFHADPHLGNIMVDSNERIVLIDLGLIGTFHKHEKKIINKAIKSFLKKDVDETFNSLLKFGVTPNIFNRELFKEDIKKTFQQLKDRHQDSKPTEHLEELVNDLFKVAYLHKLYVPQNTVLLIKTVVTLEGVLRKLDPEVKLAQLAVPIVMKSWLSRFFKV
jgi:ubiquinone biosynthesis protein